MYADRSYARRFVRGLNTLIIFLFLLLPLANAQTGFSAAVPVSVWTSADINATTPGSITESAFQVKVSGSGSGIGSTSDSFRYVYDSASSDITLSAKITAWDSGGSQTAKAGLMLRSSTKPNAAFALISLTGRRGIRFQWRSADGKRSTELAGPSSFRLPIYLKIQKSAGSVKGFYSYDGASWSSVGLASSLAMPGAYLFGMAVTSAKEGVQASATFDTILGPQPVILSYTPEEGSVGDTLEVIGEYLTAVTQVSVGGAPSEFVSQSPYYLQISVPANAASGPVKVVTAAGSAVAPVDFHLLTPPRIEAISPAAGPVRTIISIAGYNFTHAPITQVLFNGGMTGAGIPAADFTVLSDNAIRAVVPEGAGYGSIRVISAEGTATSNQLFDVTSLPLPPSLTGLNPTSGVVGDTITLQGTALSLASQVTFNGAPAAFTIINDSLMQAIVPLTAISGPVKVVTPGGTASAPQPFTVVVPGEAPVITDFTPTSGLPYVEVHLRGTGMYSVNQVYFNGTPALNFFPSSDTELIAMVPLNASSGPITITSPAGVFTTAKAFHFIQWAMQDIGSAAPGDGMIESGQTILHASGSGIGGTRDSFFYAFDTYNGSLDFRAMQTSCDLAGLPDAQSGLMIRTSTEPNAAFAYVYNDCQGQIHFRWRPKPLGDSYETTAPAPVTGPVWLSLIYMGGSIAAGYAPGEGPVVFRVFADTANAPMILPEPYLIGLAASSKVDGQYIHSVFRDITADPPTISILP